MSKYIVKINIETPFGEINQKYDFKTEEKYREHQHNFKKQFTELHKKLMKLRQDYEDVMADIEVMEDIDDCEAGDD